MRQIMLGLWLLLLVLACKNDHATGQNAGTSSTDKSVERNQSMGTPSLKNGVRWKADSNTNKNVRILLTMVQKFNADPDKSVKAYNNVAKEMEEALNNIVTDCRMQGSAHEALHQWLEPLIQKVSELRKTSKHAEGAQLWATIQNQVILYTRYFE